MTADQSAALVAQVGLFALVRRQQEIMLVRPHQLLLPGGPQSLPGCLLSAEQGGMGIAEATLRELLIKQIGISVSEFWLIGSHVIRSAPDSPLPRLNLIFGTEYISGIPAAHPKQYKSVIWVQRQMLQEKVPEWLSAALVEMDKQLENQNARAGTLSGPAKLFSRRR